jgi:hypothetical protein
MQRHHHLTNFFFAAGCLLLANSILWRQVLAQQSKFVPLPDDIRCETRGGMSIGKNGFIATAFCWMPAKSPKQEKEIALIRDTPNAAARYFDNMLPTRDFGEFQLNQGNSAVVAIGADKITILREYLNK